MEQTTKIPFSNMRGKYQTTKISSARSSGKTPNSHTTEHTTTPINYAGLGRHGKRNTHQTKDGVMGYLKSNDFIVHTLITALAFLMGIIAGLLKMLDIYRTGAGI